MAAMATAAAAPAPAVPDVFRLHIHGWEDRGGLRRGSFDCSVTKSAGETWTHGADLVAAAKAHLSDVFDCVATDTIVVRASEDGTPLEPSAHLHSLAPEHAGAADAAHAVITIQPEPPSCSTDECNSAVACQECTPPMEYPLILDGQNVSLLRKSTIDRIAAEYGNGSSEGPVWQDLVACSIVRFTEEDSLLHDHGMLCIAPDCHVLEENDFAKNVQHTEEILMPFKDNGLKCQFSEGARSIKSTCTPLAQAFAIVEESKGAEGKIDIELFCDTVFKSLETGRFHPDYYDHEHLFVMNAVSSIATKLRRQCSLRDKERRSVECDSAWWINVLVQPAFDGIDTGTVVTHSDREGHLTVSVVTVLEDDEQTAQAFCVEKVAKPQRQNSYITLLQHLAEAVAAPEPRGMHSMGLQYIDGAFHLYAMQFFGDCVNGVWELGTYDVAASHNRTTCILAQLDLVATMIAVRRWVAGEAVCQTGACFEKRAAAIKPAHHHVGKWFPSLHTCE